MGKKKKILVICLIALSVVGLLLFATYTMPILRPGSVAYAERVDLGGSAQWILVRGVSQTNPLVLFLHGGPGDSESLLFRHYQKELEDYFICVEWDQRGAGKSYADTIPESSLTLDQLIADANDLVKYLKERFGKQRIFLVGHSFGSVIGVNLITRYPEDYAAYVGVGQMVDSKEQEMMSYAYTLEQARQRGNPAALADLERIGAPIDGAYRQPLDILTQRNWLAEFNGIRVNNGDFWAYKLIVGLAPEYNVVDKLNMLTVNVKTFIKMVNVFNSVDLTNFTEFEVPVYFCLGRHDYNTPTAPVEAYFDKITTPRKELVWFENSAHAPNFEESEVFNRFMISLRE